MRCLIPIAASPASYTPGASLARGSMASEPVIPAGRGGAGSGANGFAGAAGVAAGAGDDDGVCARIFIAKQPHKTSEVNSNRKAMLITRFIVSPPKTFHPTWVLLKIVPSPFGRGLGRGLTGKKENLFSYRR